MGKQDDIRTYEQAKRALERHQGNDANDPTYQELNRAVDKAAQKVSWWRR